jgi:transposase
LPPQPGLHQTFARDHEYKRHGTRSLLAGIDLVTGKVHAPVRERHRSREFIEFLKLLDAAYPAHTAIKLINHSAHISRETKAWLADQPVHHFEFTFTPNHGSWLNLVEDFFSKLTRSVPRHIRVASRQELKDGLIAAVDYFSRDPVVRTCLQARQGRDSNFKIARLGCKNDQRRAAGQPASETTAETGQIDHKEDDKWAPG